MAKIRINGDTSGYIELSAPNVAGSTSITLPATSGGTFLVTDSSGNLNVDSGVLYVDGVNNRVGIGTTSPNVPLEVNGNARASNFSVPDTNFIGFGAYTAYLSGSSASNFLSLNTGSTERARINSSGNVGIGTASPNFTGFAGRTVTLNLDAATNGGYEIGKAGNLVAVFGVEAGTNDVRFGTTSSAALGLWANNQERMRISSNGAIRFDIPNTTAGFSPLGDANANGVLIEGGDGGAGNRPKFRIRYGTADQIYLDGLGNAQKPGGGSWAATSDSRAKEDIADYASGLSQLKQLQPRSYRYIGNDNTYIGLVAQEVEDVMPELVKQGEGELPDGTEVTDFRTLDQTPLTFALINAVKEMAKRIETLEAANAALETRLTALEVKS